MPPRKAALSRSNHNIHFLWNSLMQNTTAPPLPPLAHKPHRIELVDAIRGFALMGICLVHFMEYFELYWINQDPTTLHNIVFFLFAGKAYAIFALMFGLSFFIIMDNQAQKARCYAICNRHWESQSPSKQTHTSITSSSM